SDEGLWVRRSIPLAELRTWIPKLVEMSLEEIADLPGVSLDRAHQILPGAIVAEAILDIFALEELEICPWALREGVILARLDFLGADD
ncbi:MAG TPA: Ppx/GppA family phosphatase, partial [Nocardioides sp.]|nr:Ppx/GppA family phosphatase [Nocardioides sp.]